MFTIFNRKELITTFEFEKLVKVRDLLHANGIIHMVKVKNMNKSRRITGSFGIDMKYAYQYYLYVKKRDYDQACYVIRGGKT